MTLASADAVVPVAKKAVEAGIPLVAFNSGIDRYQEAGAKMYFGSDETLAGSDGGGEDHQPRVAVRRCA